MQRNKNKVLIAVVVVCTGCILLSFFLAASVGAAAAAPGDTQGNETATDTPAANDGKSDNNGGSIDTETTVSTIGHVTIHDIRWHDDYVEIDLTLQRPDTIQVTDYEGDAYYWQTYDLDAGTHTIKHEYRGDSGEVSIAAISEKQGQDFTEGTRFVMPGANELATLFLGVVTVLLLLAAIKLRRDRKREQGAKRVF